MHGLHMSAEVLVDVRCVDLAEHFLSGNALDTEANRAQLAIQIQGAVENWFQLKELLDGCDVCGGAHTSDEQARAEPYDMLADLKAKMSSELTK